MDRPEWCTIGVNGEVYWTMTNNTAKPGGVGGVNEVNPIFDNRDGCIIKTEDSGATPFTWEMIILSRNTRASDPGVGRPERTAVRAVPGAGRRRCQPVHRS